ncbi:MAG: BREX-1 system adenine-specific DNA-methyltransferase PglX [Absicoccus sp.]|uniref:BREX-1 system adenine-specific DNA-methyltransferase PglX n=1 Tax=Absicoccus sp. TaxID=2718527 RepID=UPI002A75B7A9|nr:BREX-1 system adenine-specific DNA-methyltransferase PglX [Absicoccus sp.]MDY3035818.1 BREX-1 system adenine-specific DNA-methyltransferase PglX [Absicoccus sp.]
MNKTAIKNFAIWARQELMARVAQKAYTYGVTETELPAQNTDAVNGRLLSNDEKNALNELVRQIKMHTYKEKKGKEEVEVSGFTHVIEEVAYTWFNRFIALRYMEVNNFLPQRIRVFTNENNEFKPEILTDAIHVELEGLNQQKVFEYIEQANDEDLYKYLLQAICSDMHQYLPEMFTSISDYKVLLFPDNLLDENSVIGRMISDIPEEDWRDQVQIIGWLYQYYNSELKNIVMKKKNYTKDDIPAVTQLFTPDWIVRYMTENSLGRIWLDGHPDFQHDQWKYYLEEAEQEPEVVEQLNKIKEEHARLKPEDIKVMDPCMGSGHILVYAFDVLMDIYRSQGYSDRDAVRSILTNNIYGLEIDERAYHLAYFSLMMKALSYDRRVLSRRIQTNLAEIVETDESLTDEVLNRIDEYKEQGQYLVDLFKEAKEYGSILNVDLSLEDIYHLESRLEELKTNIDPSNLIDQAEKKILIEDLGPLVKQAKLLVQKYEVVITNPPYMAPSPKQKPYVKKHYPDSKSDLFAVFIEKCHSLTKQNAYQAMITMHSWMFLSSYEKLRNKINKLDLINMAHLGARAFDEIGGEVVQTTMFVLSNTYTKDYKGIYCRLIEPTSEKGKEELFLLKQNRYYVSQTNFSKIPGSPVAYWCSERIIEVFSKADLLSDIAEPRQGVKTLNNDLFLKLWFEVSSINIKYDCVSIDESIASKKKWFPYNKGGSYRKWFGNNDYLVNWENDGKAMKSLAVKKYNSITRTITNISYFFLPGLTWSSLSSGNISLRAFDKGYIFDSKGSSMFFNDRTLEKYVLALVNSKIAMKFLEFLAPTLDFNIGPLSKIPVIVDEKQTDKINEIVVMCIKYAKIDWDSFETSWDFEVHPLIKNHANTIKEAFDLWNSECNDRFNTLKSNEEELNRIFIDIYGLQDELDPYVEDKDVTVHYVVESREDIPESLKNSNYVRTKQDEIKSFISYAVGCMFGRYSLDVEGLAYAGGEFDWSKYSTFIPDKDDILPICDDEYFEDDIVGRFIEFVRVLYGSETLEENLAFIAEALGGKGTPREILRNYFLNEFFKDHCNTYQVSGSGKRPIYWLFDSGRKNGFKALVYIHRYKPDLIARMRTEYIHPLQAKYRTQMDMLHTQMDSATNTSEKVKLNKKLKKIQGQASELSVYEERIHHWADKMEPMDLDDGVKANYAKFQELLAKIK